MSESEWLACDSPAAMVDFVSHRVSERKVRLFAVACCRHLGRLPPQVEFALALDASEQYADGPRIKAALKRARQAVRSLRSRPPVDRGGADEWAALWLVEVAATENAARAMADQIDRFVERGLIPVDGRPPGSSLARCVFGNPFRPAKIGRPDQASAVVDLARAIYEDRAFDRLPILGDALEEAGCVEPAVLGHCRDSGPHAKGCWVVDSILGKS